MKEFSRVVVLQLHYKGYGLTVMVLQELINRESMMQL